MMRLREIATPSLRSAAIAAALAASTAGGAPFEVLDAVQSDVSLDGARAVAVSPDGAHAYVCGFFGGTVAAFAVDGASGALTSAGFVSDGANGVAGIAGCADLVVSPDGRHVYAAGFSADALGIFARDAETGSLAFVDAIYDFQLASSALDGPSGILTSSDGAFVYVTSGAGNTLAVFARNAETGALTLGPVITNDPLALLTGPADLAISPDGALVYVVTAGVIEPEVFADALLTFERDAVSGALTNADAEQNGVAGVSGLEFPNVAAVSPDGRHVYATGGASDSIAIFARDAEDDSTHFVGAVSDADPGVEGLDAPVGIAVSSGGGWVFAAGSNASAVAIFRRDAESGALAFERAVRDADDPARRLANAIDVAVDPADRFVYVAAFSEDALTVLAPEPGAGALGLAAGATLALRGRRARARRIAIPRT